MSIYHLHQKKSPALVYGLNIHDELTFIDTESAKLHFGIHRAYRKTLTFGDFLMQYPESFEFVMDKFAGYIGFERIVPSCLEYTSDEYFNFLFDGVYEACLNGEFFEIDPEDFESKSEIKEYYEDDLSVGERMPLKHEKFCDETVDFFWLIDLIGYLGNMTWIPDDIIEKYGESNPSMLNGPIAKLYPKYEKEIVSAFEGYGYTCIRDDDLVNEACGFLQ